MSAFGICSYRLLSLYLWPYFFSFFYNVFTWFIWIPCEAKARGIKYIFHRKRIIQISFKNLNILLGIIQYTLNIFRWELFSFFRMAYTFPKYILRSKFLLSFVLFFFSFSLTLFLVFHSLFRKLWIERFVWEATIKTITTRDKVRKTNELHAKERNEQKKTPNRISKEWDITSVCFTSVSRLFVYIRYL